ncbi:tetratricopeptide repeat protein [Myroides pelagicus]|uniref:tetratricopeptide repeat protein n=1 Tax=Myroides pelagicus TaxID=270914 RepID=UPI002DBB22E9|nr:tetratricopeptide repeat protein [Myroides pelagicus]MEC4112771.1 tetratricopeptide repeat protein [Myroides pelagicus]
MGTFNTEYLNYVSQVANDSKSLVDHARELLQLNNYEDPHMWFKAHAVCMFATQIGEESEEIIKLYNQLFEESNCIHSGMRLNEADYRLWFADVQELNRVYIEKGYARAYAYQYELYERGRYGFKNKEICKELLDKGCLGGDDYCQIYKGNCIYYGIFGYEENREEGLRLVTEIADRTGGDLAELFLLNMKTRSCETSEELWAIIEQYDKLLNIDKKGKYILADYYLRVENDAKAVESLLEGIDNGSPFCNYLMGLLIVNGRFASFGYTEEQGRAYLDVAFDYGVIHAGFIQGYFYLYPVDGGANDFEHALPYLKAAALYNSPEALLELAMLSMYHNDYKDIAQGRVYLDRAVEEEFVKAYTEKAYMLLDFPEVERNVPEAKRLLELAMDKGNDYAPYRLGLGYQNAEFEEESDYEKALYLYELAAERNNLSGLEMAGRYNRYGYVNEPNLAKAIAHYERGIADFGSDYCRVELAMMLVNGEGQEPDAVRAEQLFHEALENGYIYASLRLGFLYEDGYLGESDPVKAREYFEKGALGEQPLAESVYHLGRCYRYGIGGEEDHVKAMELFEQALELGFVDANVDIALAYEEGTCGKESNPQEAIKYMSIAAEAGINYAQYKLGSYYLFGYDMDVNLEEGKKWLMSAVDNGSPLAMLTMGDYYLYGYEPETVYDPAFEFYKGAEERGYISEGLGICYQYGVGVEKDETLAYSCYTRAAERGYDSATYRLAQCYYFGIGTDKDRVEAFHYFKEVADRGNIDAAGYVGIMLVSGDGVEQDAEYGVSYLIQAADADNDLAQYELANCYLKGEGVEQSDDLAMEWYSKAAENGNEDAQKIIGGPRKRRR